MSHPILYSFRRCPYAMRARMAIFSSGMSVLYREVSLKNKPEALLTCSPKGTVPVLVTPQQTIIDESLDIMRWALQHNDPENWSISPKQHSLATTLMTYNDGPFKRQLDQYKYADRYPEQPQHYYRQQGEQFLSQLEERLSHHPHLLGEKTTLVDIAIMPFIRQFAHVDHDWFQSSPYPRLQVWLESYLQSALFQSIMSKQAVWQPHDPPLLFPFKASVNTRLNS
ncbi:MAG TPA: glutathione S-transferase [Gammaproteobacteria bacterium]|nr:glutathione S-transferase [Gammaproteobacteria bacterium]